MPPRAKAKKAGKKGKKDAVRQMEDIVEEDDDVDAEAGADEFDALNDALAPQDEEDVLDAEDELNPQALASDGEEDGDPLVGLGGLKRRKDDDEEEFASDDEAEAEAKETTNAERAIAYAAAIRQWTSNGSTATQFMTHRRFNKESMRRQATQLAHMLDLFRLPAGKGVAKGTKALTLYIMGRLLFDEFGDWDVAQGIEMPIASDSGLPSDLLDKLMKRATRVQRMRKDKSQKNNGKKQPPANKKKGGKKK
jgi:hypothetical protein